jgi:hypothetical protein
MARRKLWSDLSLEYRQRLYRHGIGYVAHDFLDADLTEARGHLYTPEHGDWPFVLTLRPANGRVVSLVRYGPSNP